METNPYLTQEQRAILSSVHIGVAGLGGLGSNLLSHLVRSGAVHFTVADFDTVSAGNLNRQFFFADQIGKRKTEAVAENLKRINPDVDLELHTIRITRENVSRLFEDCDIVAEAFDTPEAKMFLIEELRKAGKTVVAASGLAGFGRSNEMRLRKAGERLYIAGDLVSAISPAMPPASPRVGIAAAMQANTIIAFLLGIAI